MYRALKVSLIEIPLLFPGLLLTGMSTHTHKDLNYKGNLVQNALVYVN